MAATHARRQLRLRGWDCSRPATYSVTISTINSADLLGEVVCDEMVPNAIGEIVADCWRWLGHHFAHVVLDEWTLMPTHSTASWCCHRRLHRRKRQLPASARV
jgi:hypothetical protein